MRKNYFLIISTIFFYCLMAIGFSMGRVTVPSKNPAIGMLLLKDGGFCTAFIYGQDSLMTARHCTMGQRPYAVRFPDGQEISVRTVEMGTNSQEEDWALLSGPTGDRVPLPLNGSIPLSNSKCVHIGYGAEENPKQVLVGCVVRGLNEGYIVLYGTAIPGDSGSPVIGEDGAVFGIVSKTALTIPHVYAVRLPKEFR